MPFIPAAIGAIVSAVGSAASAVGAVATGTATAAQMAGVALGVGAVGTGITAYGQYAAGQQQKANAEYNAKIQLQQAEEERKAASYEAGLIGEEGRRLQARQRLGFAARGLGGAGTPLLVLQDTANKIQQHIQMIVQGGGRRANYYTSASRLSLMQGKSSARAGLIGLGSSLLSGGAESLYRYKQML